MSDVKYVYAVCPHLLNGKLVVQRAEITKETDRRINIKPALPGYGYRTQLDPDDVARSFDAAVSTFINGMKREIEQHAEQIRQCNALIALTPVPDYAEVK